MTGTGRRWLRATSTSWVLEFSDGSTLQSPPVAGFNARQSGLVVSFDAAQSFSTSGALTAFAWDFGDGATSTASAPTHTYTAGGTYSVRLSVTDAKGGTDSFTQPLLLSAPTNLAPTAIFTFSVSNTSGQVTFNAGTSQDTDGTISRYDWTFGDGLTGSGVSVSHTYTTTGTYSVQLKVTDNQGAAGSQTQSVAVTNAAPPTPSNVAPTASFTSAVSGATVAFNGSGSKDSDGSIAGYAWTFGDGSTGTGQSPSYTYKASGTYTVTLTVTDDKGATGSVSHSVTPAITPPPPPSGSGGDNGGTGVTPSGAGIVSYNSLAGANFSARVDAGGTNKVALPPGAYSFSDFTINGGGTPPSQFWFGARITTGGILGAGSKYTTIQMTPGTSTKSSDVPAQGTGASNQLNLITMTAAGATVDGVKIIGTSQGHLYNGLRFESNASPTFTNSTITGIPGNASSPPGETFGCNFQRTSGTATVSNITFDGQNIEACGFGSNSASAHFIIHNIYCVNLKYSAGWATWQQTGAMEFYNFVTKNSARSLNAERLAAHVQFFDPIWDQPLVGHDLNITYETGWTGGTIDFRFTDQAAWNAFVANRTTKKIMPISNPSSVSLGLSKTDSIKVYIAGVLQTQGNYVAWQGI